MSAQASTLPIDVWREAAQRADVIEAMHRFYLEVTRRVAAHGATCWNRGACCRFGQYGHRLYVTSLEVAFYLSGGCEADPADTDACPHARDGRCHVRDLRPMGCRVFYCDPGAQEWQGPLTEELLAKLRRLHEQLDVPYAYVDWIAALQSLRDSPPMRIDR